MKKEFNWKDFNAEKETNHLIKLFDRRDLKIEPLDNGWERVSFVEKGFCYSCYRKGWVHRYGQKEGVGKIKKIQVYPETLTDYEMKLGTGGFWQRVLFKIIYKLKYRSKWNT